MLNEFTMHGRQMIGTLEIYKGEYMKYTKLDPVKITQKSINTIK